MEWWAWLIVGIVLFAIELFSPSGFYLLILGVSAICVGLLGLAGVTLSTTLQLLCYAVLTIILYATIRRPLYSKFVHSGHDVTDELSGKEVLVIEDIAPGSVGKGELRGSTWQVRNVGNSVVTTGSRCIVQKVEGITLLIG
jgi:membrane protein implicated in regulation of membrane protease activity